MRPDYCTAVNPSPGEFVAIPTNTCLAEVNTYDAPSQYGVKDQVSLLVRVGGKTQDIPRGWRIPACYIDGLPLQFDVDNYVLTVGLSTLDLSPLRETKLCFGPGAPTEPPADGYLPIYLDTSTKETWYWCATTWIKGA